MVSGNAACDTDERRSVFRNHMIITLGIQRIFNFLNLNISMHILQTVLHTFFKVLTRTIYLKQSLASLVGDHFLYSHDLNV